MFQSILFVVLLNFLFNINHSEARQLSEPERVAQWYARNNTWPPNWQPERETFKAAMARREEQIMMIPGARERWENWMQYTQSRLVPIFTENGFKVIQTPESVQRKLKAALDRGLQNFDAIRDESDIDLVYTPVASKFIDLHGVNWEIMEEMKHLHEEWSGLQLTPRSAYGLRLYRNGSSLAMHYDKVQTHVISSIVHVGHEYDDDNHPWPIEIEDHDGNLHIVNLQAGQMLFYESSSSLHGRRSIFRGKYYASIFVHYQPVDKTIWNYTIDDVINSVPPHWQDGTIEELGSRWCGQGITTEDMVTEGAPPRVIEGKIVPDLKKFWDKRRARESIEL